MPNEYYVADTPTPLDSESNQRRLVQRLRQHLEVRNLTVLVGNGCSLPLGAPPIGRATTIKAQLDEEPYRLGDAAEHKRARALLDVLLKANDTIGVEALLTTTINLRASDALLHAPQTIGTDSVTARDALLLERLLKKWLYGRCKALTAVSDDRLRDHEELFRRLLLRSTTLPRAKVFTTNYDLLIERALDNLGVLYFDGFLGTIHRTLRTESYHYDLYYPGETTEGRVSRVDRVLHLYKLHGSINWRRRLAGPGDVTISHADPIENEYGDVMIYPSPLKVTEINGYPYSEMFRHLSAAIHQPQSVLLAVGYKFQDDHVNRLIYQALSIPSFTLIIVTPSTPAPPGAAETASADEISRLIYHVKSNRILVIAGGTRDSSGQYIEGAGTFHEFSTKWLPDIRELDVESSARDETRRALRPLMSNPTEHDDEL